jgi:ribosomal-protein-alanine N-acetyltransferase
VAYAIRPMTVADIPQVTAIEREAFPTTFPSTSYERELRNTALSAYWVAWTTEETAPPPLPPEPTQPHWRKLASVVRWRSGATSCHG